MPSKFLKTSYAESLIEMLPERMRVEKHIMHLLIKNFFIFWFIKFTAYKNWIYRDILKIIFKIKYGIF